jgi:hypothetical protein
VLVALLLVGVAGAAVVQELAGGLDAPSPAQGHAQVVAQGVAPMPADQIAWRVVRDTAEATDDAEYQARALGFALAVDDAIVVSSATFGTQARLAPGEAAFVPDGAFELRTSATDQAVPYARLALVPAEAAADGGGDTLLYAGDAFAAPSLPNGSSGFDLDLVRDVLEDGEETELPDTGYPTLIYVTAGSIEIDNVAQNAISLAAGEAIAVPGNAEISADGEDAAFVAALIGPAVPIPPAPPRTTGTITITTSFCQADTTAENFDPDACTPGPVEGGLALVAGDGSTIEAAGDQADEGVYLWNGLAFATYALADLDPQESYEPFVLLDANGDELDAENLTISGDAPDLSATLYLLPAEAETGSFSLATYVCPEGMTPENMVGDACDLAQPGTFDWQIGPVDAASSEEILTLADATGDGQPFFTWEDLPAGDYVLSPLLFPEGYALVVVPGAEPGPQQTFGVTIGPDQPDLELLAYFFLQPEEPVGAGSLTATFNLCAQGSLPSAFDPGQCQPVIGTAFDFGFDISNNDTGAAFSLADAAISEATAVWSDLPLGVYSLYPTPGPGYELVAIPNADGGDGVTGPFVVELSEAAPDRGIDVYFFPPSGNVGTVAFVAYQCPAAESTDEECLANASAFVDADLFDAGGNPLPANLHGNNLVWGEGEGLPVGTYRLVLDLSTLPAGYALDRMIGAYDDGDGDPSTWLVDVTEAAPNALVSGLLIPA